jgi:hypothetical protein
VDRIPSDVVEHFVGVGNPFSMGEPEPGWNGCGCGFDTLMTAGRRLTEGGSDEGGLEELVELVLSRSFNSAIRRSKDRTSGVTAAWASGESVSQMAGGSGG